MSLPIDQIVSIQVLTSATPPQKQGFGAFMFLGTETVLPLESRVLSAVQASDLITAGFATTDQAYLAAQVYFGQSPKPRGPFKVGRQFLTAQAGKLLGATSVSNQVSAYTGITSGGFDISIDGTNRQISAINLSGAANMAAVASTIQTRLQAALASTTCTWDATKNRFVITSPTTGSSSAVLFGAAPTAAGPPTDISALLGLQAVQGARTVQGIAIESITAALTATRLADPAWYGFALPSASTLVNWQDAMAYGQSVKAKCWVTTPDANCYDSNTTADLMSYAKSHTYDHAFVIYSNTAYAAVSAAAREQVVDVTQTNAFITLNGKQLVGIPTEDQLSLGQVVNIRNKYGNVNVNFAGLNMLYGGQMGSGQFSDEVFGLDAFASDYQNAIATAILTTPTKIAQTDKGAAYLLGAGAGICEQYVRNGFCAPGTWTSAPIDGLVNTGDFLKDGYRQLVGKVAAQSVSDRANRIAPPITVILKGAGAFHSAAVTVIFDR